MNTSINKENESKPETKEQGFIFCDKTKSNIDCILANKNIPIWAKEDLLIKDMVNSGVGNFIFCRSYGDEFIDQFKPPFHRGYIYFDGEKYYIKRWKISYISGAPIKGNSGYNVQEEYIINKEEYNDLVLFSKDVFLNKENER